MGAVYEGQHTLIGRRAAIKVLLPELSSNREIVDRFFNEARATTSISDAGIVQVFDFGVHSDNSAYIVMEFLEGEPLDTRMKRLGRISPFDAMRITRQASGSLAAAHQRGIVHRDLKPENIFLVPDQEAQGGERPKILDFGIAKLSGPESKTKTRTGVMMGTPVYMSPEQCRGSGSLDHRSDIYSLGCVLYHMLTGRPPFDAEGMGELIAMHLREPAIPPSAIVPGIGAVDELVLKCLEKSPDQRFQNMTDLQRAADGVMTRITNNGASAQTLAIATPVPPGFRTEIPGASSSPLPGTVVLGKPTTLSAAAGEAGASSSPKRKWGLVAAVVVVLGGGGIAAAVLAGGKDKAETSAASPETPPTVSTPADAAAAVTAAPADATAVTAVAVDAGVPAPDAATAVVVAPADAGTKLASDPKKPPTRPKKPPKTGSASGGNLYDDR
jgi:eukaryotic-like serine/threonine-protein kinase